MVFSNFSFRMHPKIVKVSYHLCICFKVPAAQFTFQQWKQPEICCLVDASSFQCCGTQATLAQEQLYATKHCLGEESTDEEVLVSSTKYGEGFFPVPSCNTPNMSVFLEGRCWRPSLSNRRMWQLTSLVDFCWRNFFVLDSLLWRHTSDSRFVF